MLALVITAASVQDRDGARPLLWNLSHCCTRVRLAWADVGYTGKARRLGCDLESAQRLASQTP